MIFETGNTSISKEGKVSDNVSNENGSQTPRGWARERSNDSSNSSFIGNQHIVPAAWSENYEDVWSFSRKTTGSGNKTIVIKVSNNGKYSKANTVPQNIVCNSR